MEARCRYCEETDNLDTCRHCMKPICPNHRWGTGQLSDGYYCLSSTNECVGDGEDESPMAKIMGLPMKPERTIYQRINAAPWWVIVTAGLFLGLILIAATWRR